MGTRRLQGVVGPGATSVRASSIRRLEKVGKVSVSGTLAWSELQKECAKGGRDGGWAWIYCPGHSGEGCWD